MGFTIMGGDVNGIEQYQYINSSGWAASLRLANAYGWKPEGTKLPVWVRKDNGKEIPVLYASDCNDENATWSYTEDWDGSYCSNGYQEISETDASHLAMALEKALKDLPYNAEIFEARSANLETENRELLRDIIQRLSIERNQDLLVKMIAVLRTGACNIF